MTDETIPRSPNEEANEATVAVRSAVCSKGIALRKNYRIAIFGENSPTEYSGGRYHSWMMGEALAAAGHEVHYVTNNLPIFYRDFLPFTHHRDLRVCILPQLGQERLSGEADGDLRLEPVPFHRLLAESRATLLTEEALGDEVLAFQNAAARDDLEVLRTDPYVGTYQAEVTATQTPCGAGRDRPSRYCLKIVACGSQRSGVHHPAVRINLEAGRRYFMSCRVWCEQARSAFRLSLKSDLVGNLWAIDTVTNSINYSNRAGQWTQLSGVLTMPPGPDHPSQVWVMNWDESPLTWYLDDVSIRPISDSLLKRSQPRLIPDGFSSQGLPDCDRILTRTLRERSLVICRPFLPSPATDASCFSYFFVDPEALDPVSIDMVASNYSHILIEDSVADRLQTDGRSLPPGARRTETLVGKQAGETRLPRVLFLASNDTHAHYLLRVAEHFPHRLFVIPKRARKDEGAGEALRLHGVNYIEVDYHDRQSRQIDEFQPDVVVCGSDWTSEFIAVQSIVCGRRIPCIALQEGPQDWEQKIKGVDPLKFRNAEILFSQGAVTLKYIRPKYFSVTGNPKTDHIETYPLPKQPRVLINCNFTYGQYEEHRERWMHDVLSICKELDLNYIISRHPRDQSNWHDPNLVESSTFALKDQILECSVVVSRFSNLTYEALSYGRCSVYYNPHGEPMKTFVDDPSKAVSRAFDRAELKSILQQHRERPRFGKQDAYAYMSRHCGPMDHDSVGRIVGTIRSIVALRLSNNHVISREGRALAGRGDEILFSVVICTHNRAEMLDRCIRSVLITSSRDIRYEVIVVDNASSDDTPAVVESYRDRDEVRYVYEPRLGLSTARNTGWQNARGRYVVFLDDDGEAVQGWLRAFLDVFEAHPDAVACGGRIIARYETRKPSWIRGVMERFYGEYNLAEDVTSCDWVPGGNAAWRHDALKSLGGFDERFGRVGSSPQLGSEESVLIKKATERGAVLYYTPHAAIYHHVSRAKLRFRWMAARYFGQGVTAIRWGFAFRGGWSRAQAVRHCLAPLRSIAGQMITLLGRLLLLRGSGVVGATFEIFQQLGRAVESSRIALGRVPRLPPDCQENHIDLVVLTPNNEIRSDFYDDVRGFAQSRSARLILLNFETANWFNAMSPVKRDEVLWENWKACTQHLDMVLSSTAESRRFARAFFRDCRSRTLFDYCYPAINTFAADAVPQGKRERRIVLFARFVRAEHKGCSQVPRLLCEAMGGHTLVVIVGTGGVPAEVRDQLEEAAARLKVTIEYKYRLSDQEKFRELKSAKLMLFPSLFEGFGLPPVEALYCNVPCIAFDLPVLREVCGESLIYVKAGDWDHFKEEIRIALTRRDTAEQLSAGITRVARFEEYVRRADHVVQRVMAAEGGFMGDAK